MQERKGFINYLHEKNKWYFQKTQKNDKSDFQYKMADLMKTLASDFSHNITEIKIKGYLKRHKPPIESKYERWAEQYS